MASKTECGGFVQLRARTIIENEIENYFRDNQIPLGEPVMLAKMPTDGISPGTINLTTNIYGIVMSKRPVYRYNVSVLGRYKKCDGTFMEFDLTKKAKEDAVTIDRRDRCRDVILALKKQQDTFFREKHCIYYDLQSILFSLEPLDINKAKTFDIDQQELPKSSQHFDMCRVVIRTIAGSSELMLGDFGMISEQLSEADRSLPQFLDIATSQYIMFNPGEHVTFSTHSSYLLRPDLYHLNEADLAYFDDTYTYLSFGVQKSVRIIEGPMRDRVASLVVSTKKTPFHATGPLLEKVRRLLNGEKSTLNVEERQKLARFLKGLYVETKHTKHLRRYEIKDISDSNANEMFFVSNETKISVFDYFAKTHQLELEYSSLPLVVVKGRNKETIYLPIEVCEVSDNQRVKTHQLTPKMTQTSIKKCSVPPSILLEQNELSAKSLHLWDSPWLSEANIQLTDRVLSLRGRSLPNPEIEFGDGPTRVSDRFDWRGRRFRFPASCKMWAAYAFLDGRERFDFKEFEGFLKEYIREASCKGLRMPEPADYDICDSKFETIDQKFKMADQHGCNFVFVVHSDNGDAAHACVKYVERVYSLASQCVRLITLRNVLQKNQRLTLGNIVNKTNVKLGGLNYTLVNNSPITRDILGTETLFIGIGINHPGGGLGTTNADDEKCSTLSPLMELIEDVSTAPPTCIGYAANVGANNEFDFCGDIFFQAPRREEKANLMLDIVERCVLAYFRSRNTNISPKRVIIYTLCSEGSYSIVLKYEVPLIKTALQRNNCNAKLTLIVGNKFQDIRFFKTDINPTDKPIDQNIKPGVVVDNTVVHPLYREFFLNSHRALQGTTRTPKYTVLYDESEFGLDQLENITYHLCFSHQIIFSTTSLPTPMYVANRYAERGRMLYQQWLQAHKGEKTTYHELTNLLCYFKSKDLFGRRINA